MKLRTSSKSGGFQQPPAGTYLARCVKLIDVGTQKTEYQGTVKEQHQMVLGWELPTELISDGEAAGQPYVVTKWYTASLHEKANLRKDLSTWRNREFSEEELEKYEDEGFELHTLLGVPAMVTVTETGDGKVKVTAVTSPPKGTKVPKQINELFYLSLEPNEFSAATFELLGEKMQQKIALSPEYKLIMDARHPADTADDDFAPEDFSGGEDDIEF
jgi:hypothetical protein